MNVLVIVGMIIIAIYVVFFELLDGLPFRFVGVVGITLCLIFLCTGSERITYAKDNGLIREAVEQTEYAVYSVNNKVTLIYHSNSLSIVRVQILDAESPYMDIPVSNLIIQPSDKESPFLEKSIIWNEADNIIYDVLFSDFSGPKETYTLNIPETMGLEYLK